MQPDTVSDGVIEVTVPGLPEHPWMPFVSLGPWTRQQSSASSEPFDPNQKTVQIIYNSAIFIHVYHQGAEEL